VAAWQIYPLFQRTQPNNNTITLKPMKLTLVGIAGKTVNLNEVNISKLSAIESKGGLKTSAGSLQSARGGQVN
jgi:hypothetical protein